MHPWRERARAEVAQAAVTPTRDRAVVLRVTCTTRNQVESVMRKSYDCGAHVEIENKNNGT